MKWLWGGAAACCKVAGQGNHPVVRLGGEGRGCPAGSDPKRPGRGARANLALRCALVCLVLFWSCSQALAVFLPEGGASDGPVASGAQAQKGAARPGEPGQAAARKQGQFAKDKILVKFKTGVAESAKGKLHKKHGSTRLKAFKRLNIHHLKLKAGTSVEQALRTYRADPAVAYAEPDYTVSATALPPNDSYYGSTGSWGQSYQDLWGLYKINCAAAWEVTQGSPEVVVAVSDSGIDFNHPDLQGNIWTNPRESSYDGIDDDSNSFVDDLHGWNFLAHNNNPDDDRGHGTHVAGIIAAATNNGIGVAGVSWNAKIMPLKFLDAYGYGNISDGAASIIYAVDNGAKVINLSWGSPDRSQTLEDAIDYAFSQGVVVVAAAGNETSDARGFFPAGFDNVITVAATDNQDRRASFSNFGPAVEVSAPGMDILSLRAGTTDMYYDGTHVVGTNYYRANGTSMAAPYVSGLAALLVSQNPGWSNRQVMGQIVGTADRIADASLGAGRINAVAALTGSPAQTRVIYLERTLDDSAGGNGNGRLDPGETVRVVARVGNYGAPANVTVTLTSSDPYVTIDNNSAALGTLGTWETGGNTLAPFMVTVSPDAPTLHNVSFTVRVSANDGSYSSVDFFNERVSAQVPGWPVATAGDAWQDAVLADLDGDGAQEVLMATDQIHVLKGDGSELAGWPKEMPWDMVPAPLVVGDLDHNGKKVILAPGATGIHAWNADGSTRGGFPLSVPDGPIFVNLILADLDGDGFLEIIGVSHQQGKAYAWRRDGTPLEGWPVSFESGIHYTVDKIPAVGDLDGDGTLELLVPIAQNRVHAWHHDGTPVAGWPVTVPGFPGAVATADLRHDGRSQVFVSTDYAMVHAFDGTGTPLPGWPVTGYAPAIGDVNGDGELEIVTEWSGQLSAYRGDGSLLPGWPQQHLSTTMNAPVLGDVDGDGKVDILLGTAWGIYAWHGDGQLIPEFPILLTTAQTGGDLAPALGDINGDGRIDLVTGSPAHDGLIHAFQLPGPYAPRLVPWPMSRLDAQGTSQLFQFPAILSSGFSGVLGLPLNERLAVRGGYAPYSWQLTGGSLPPGLSLNPASGEVAGTPSLTGSYGSTVRVWDANGATASRDLTAGIEVVAVTTAALPGASLGAPYAQTLAVAGGTAPYLWKVLSGALPAGLALDPASGVISGHPTATGRSVFTVQVLDSLGWLATRELAIEVSAYGELVYPNTWLQAMTLDREGNLYLTGWQQDPWQLIVAKRDPTGKLVWQRGFDGDNATNIAVDATGHVYVAGYQLRTNAEYSFLMRYDAAGNLLWTRECPTGVPHGLAADAAGNAYLSGRPINAGSENFLLKYDAAGGLVWAKTDLPGFAGPVALGPDGNLYASFDGTVVKYTPAGAELWSRGYGDASGGLVVGSDNSVLVSGWGLNKYDAAGNLLWMQPYPENTGIYSMAADGNGNSYLTGSAYSDHTGSSADLITMKYSRDGALVWSRTVDRGSDEMGMAVVADPDGTGLYVAAWTNLYDSTVLRYHQPAVSTGGGLPEATASLPLARQLDAVGGQPPYTWSLSGGELPAGLFLDAATGTLSGIPWFPGGYGFTLRVSDAAGFSDLKTFSLTVLPGASSVADFGASPLVGQAPLLVNFSDASSNSPTSWSWLFGDGSSGSGSRPSHLYTAPGSYTVSLTATGAGGAESISRAGVISVLACTNAPIRLAGDLPASFADAAAAYQAALDQDVIQLMALEQGGALELNREIGVTLKGGYDCAYSDNPLTTPLTGSIRVTAGSVKLENLRFR